MKKILSFAVAVLMSMTMFAQNYHYYQQTFSDSASALQEGWISAISYQGQIYYGFWQIDDEYGYISSYSDVLGDRDKNQATTINNMLQSPIYKLNIQDTNGFLAIGTQTITFESTGVAANSISILVYIDTFSTPKQIEAGKAILSEDGYQYLVYDLGELKNTLGLQETDRDYQFIIVHGQTLGDESLLIINDFTLGTKPLTISFLNEDNGVSGSMPDMTVFANKAFAVPANNGFVRDGYEIVGWYTTDEDGEYWVMVGDTVAVDADMRFFARWGIPTEITFDANGGQGTFTTSILVADTISPDDPGHYYWAYYPVVEMPDASTISNGNLSLAGWNTEADGSGDNYAAGDYAICWEATTFYAQWTEKQPEGINDVELTGVSIYPNPATSMVRINGVDNARIELMDMSGRTLLRNTQSNSINLAGIANGVYMLRISTSEGSTTRQIIKK
ncbi:MAG: T9SS type A sorting domain-containing protein [Bacteroidales bacterium]|nr:T9SS type A sorting domain-containing protein [Bacteroidales bacterium]